MPNPNSEILDIRGGVSPIMPARIAAWPSRIGHGFRTLVARYLAWRARQVTLHLLSKLDAATLRDLGITDIESAVCGDPLDRMRGYEPNWWQKTC
jgi:uncharacterized protein YjiS (DUF1127 family)